MLSTLPSPTSPLTMPVGVVMFGEVPRTVAPVPVEVVAPVPPLPTARVPVTPGVTLAVPLNEAVEVEARLVRKVLAFASAVAVPALPVTVVWSPVFVPDVLASRVSSAATSTPSTSPSFKSTLSIVTPEAAPVSPIVFVNRPPVAAILMFPLPGPAFPATASEPSSEIVAPEFCTNLPVVLSNLAMALSVELAGPTTSPEPAGVAKVPSPRKKVVVLFGGVGTPPPTVADIDATLAVAIGVLNVLAPAIVCAPVSFTFAASAAATSTPSTSPSFKSTLSIVTPLAAVLSAIVLVTRLSLVMLTLPFVVRAIGASLNVDSVEAMPIPLLDAVIRLKLSSLPEPLIILSDAGVASVYWPNESSLTVKPLFCINLPVVLSNLAIALSVELAGPTTSPVLAVAPSATFKSVRVAAGVSSSESPNLLLFAR